MKKRKCSVFFMSLILVLQLCVINTYADTNEDASNSIVEFFDGVYYQDSGETRNVTIERGELPESMSGFSHISVIGSDIPWEENSIFTTMEEIVVFGYGLEAYNEVNGYNSGIYENTLIILFTEDRQVLGYYVDNGVDPITLVEFTEGVYFNNDDPFSNVRVERTQLAPELAAFTHIRVVGSDMAWDTNSIKNTIYATIEHGYGLAEYDDINGYSSSIYDNTLVLLFTDSREFLGYYVMNGPITPEPPSIVELEQGVEITDFEENSLVSVFRAELPEAVRGFTNIHVLGSDNNIDSLIALEMIEEMDKLIYGGEPIQVYDDNHGIQWEKYENTLVILYDDELSPLAYYIRNGSGPIQTTEIRNGIYFTEYEDHTNVWVDRNGIPEFMSGFTYMSVVGSDLAWDTVSINGAITEIIEIGNGLELYDDFIGYNCDIYRNTLVVIFSENLEPLGYLVRNELPPFELVEFTTGVVIEEYDDYNVVKVIRDILPEEMRQFTHISVTGSNTPWVEGQVRSSIEASLRYGYGLAEYDPINGYGCSSYDNTLIVLYSETLIPLGYYVINNEEPIGLVEIRNGIYFYENNGFVNIRAIREDLPTSVSNFTHMSVTGSDESWHMDSILSNIDGVIEFGFGLEEYDDEKGYFANVYENTLVVLYSDTLEPLAYYVVNEITPFELIEFESGVVIEEFEDYNIVRVDRNELPEEMAAFTHISVWGSDNQWNESNIRGVIEDTIRYGYGLFEYNEIYGYGSGKYKNTLVLLFNDNKEFLGYYKLNGEESLIQSFGEINGSIEGEVLEEYSFRANVNDMSGLRLEFSMKTEGDEWMPLYNHENGFELYWFEQNLYHLRAQLIDEITLEVVEEVIIEFAIYDGYLYDAIDLPIQEEDIPEGWYIQEGSEYYGGNELISKIPESKFEFDFVGTGFLWYGKGNPYTGIAEVRIDGVSHFIDTYRPGNVSQTVLALFNDLDETLHHVEIIVTGDMWEGGKGSAITLDKIKIFGYNMPWFEMNNNNIVSYEEHEALISYSGNWIEKQGQQYSGDLSKDSITVGDKIELRFYGSGLKLFSKTNKYMGIAEILIDGVPYSMDQYSSRYLYDQEVFSIEGLDLNPHFVEIVVTGSKNDNSLASIINLDRIEIKGDFPELMEVIYNKYEENDFMFIDFDEGWKLSGNSNCSGGFEKVISVPGRGLTFEYFGNGFKYYGKTNRYTGKFDVYIDDIYYTTIDTNSNQTNYQVPLFQLYHQEVGLHKVRIELSDDPSNIGKALSLDYLEVVFGGLEPVTTEIVVDDSDPFMLYSDHWTEQLDDGYYGGSEHITKVIGASVAFEMVGTSCEVFGKRNKYTGVCDVYVDGDYYMTVDTYSSLTLKNSSLFRIEGLSNEAHMIEMVLIDDINPEGLGQALTFDRVVY